MLAQLLIIGTILALIFRIWIYPRIKFAQVDKIPGPTPGLLGSVLEMGTAEKLLAVN